MTLAAGSRLGPYEIVSPLGAGGMGEVYRARDTRLDRTVAIKVLPAHLAGSPDRRQRLEREARTVSQLNHPHICALYDVGHQDGVDFLVLEYLEGQSLADRLQKGPLPLDQALRHGIEIADALHRAHRQGVVHRDLKPANVMLTRSGAKLLDFGLAKIHAMEEGSALSQLSALATTDKPLTKEGTLLGTFQYMAPEQLEGREADARTDIFALGTVLYEMVTGRKAFSGKSQASMISAVMKEDPPPISQLQPMTPPALDHVVKTCLAKDPEDRWQSAADVERELRWIGGGSAGGVAAPVVVSSRRRNRERIAWTLASIFLLGTVGFAFAFLRHAPVPAARVVRFQIPAPARAEVTAVALSPDGGQLAFTATSAEGTSTLWIRSLDAIEGRPIAGTEGAMLPFWSPDGRSLGFFAGGSLKAVDVASGVAQTICRTSMDPRGGAWGPSGVIVFAPTFQGPLLQVLVAGGTPTAVTTLDIGRKERTHRWPSFLPDGRHFLYYATRGQGEEPGELFVGSLDGMRGKPLFSSSSLGVYASPGYVLFDRGTGLLAQPFDPDRLEPRGAAFAVSGQLKRDSNLSGFRSFSASASGVLAFQPGSLQVSRLVWLDRGGRELGTIGSPSSYYSPRLSLSGSQLAVTRWDPQTTAGDIWVFDLGRGVGSRFTFDPADDSLAVWSRDGQRLIFASSREGAQNLYQARSDRAGSDELLLRSEAWKSPDDVSPDGRLLLYETMDAKGIIGLWTIPLSGERTPKPFVAGEFPQYSGVFSPDGRWVAYVSSESGRPEVYVQAFPGPGGKWQVSNSGGGMPRWRSDGRELFYVGVDGSFMAVEVGTGDTFEARPPQALFRIRTISAPDRQYEASPDGKRFLVITSEGSAESAPVTVVLNWAAGQRSP